jgi:hypothetical protein
MLAAYPIVDGLETIDRWLEMALHVSVLYICKTTLSSCSFITGFPMAELVPIHHHTTRKAN